MSRSRLAEIASRVIRTLAVREDTVMLVLAVVVGALTGATTALFAKLVHIATDVSFGFVGQGLLGALGGFAILLLPVLGGLIGGVLVHVFAPEAGGNGVPQVMEAVALRGGRIRPIVVVIKSVAAAVCIGSGGSAGREGPIVQIGAGVGSTVGQVLGLSDRRVRNLVASGAAAGIAAAFNAPIAGVFFALEVIVGDFSGRAFSTVVIAAVIATVVATGLLGNEVPFVVPEYNLVSAWELLIYVVLGLACAVVGVLFIRALHASEGFFEDRVRLPRWLKPAIGGLGVGAIGLFMPQVMGTGHHTIDASLFGQIPWQTLGMLVVLKIVATSLTLGSGGAGGDMAPSLFVGAMVGGLFGHFANAYWPAMSAPVGAYALVGMAALFSATARAPITAVLMLFEMTRTYDIILPLMFAVAVSTIFASILHRDGIYNLKLRARGIDLARRRDRGKLARIKVKEAMKPVEKLTTVSADLSLTEMGRLFHDSYHHGFAVLDNKGELYGIMTLEDFHRALSRNPDASTLTVGEVCVRDVFTAFPDDSVEDVLTTFGALDVGRIPVVAPNNPRRLVGMLRWSDTVRSYSQVMLDLEYEAGTSLIRCKIREGDFAAGKPLRELGLPADCVVNQIQRGKHLVVPRGDTVVRSGDVLVVLSTRGDDEHLSRLLCEGALR